MYMSMFRKHHHHRRALSYHCFDMLTISMAHIFDITLFLINLICIHKCKCRDTGKCFQFYIEHINRETHMNKCITLLCRL